MSLSIVMITLMCHLIFLEDVNWYDWYFLYINIVGAVNVTNNFRFFESTNNIYDYYLHS